MIRDAKQSLLSPLLGAYVAWKVGRAFRGLWIDGVLPEDEQGLLVYANHASFWDGFVAHALCRRFGRDGYALMEERQLARYRFLRRLGAFSIRRGDATSALETLRHARRLLDRPRAAVFVFPQGRIAPRTSRPLEFERGVEVLARMTEGLSVPVAFRYAFFESEYPDVLIRVGAPHRPESRARMQERLNALVSGLADVEQPRSFDPLLQGRRSVAERWDAVRGLA